MNIRCICGNETTINPGGRPGYILRDESWFDKGKSEIRCPKCKSTELPLELIDGSDPSRCRSCRVAPSPGKVSGANPHFGATPHSPSAWRATRKTWSNMGSVNRPVWVF